MNVEGKRKGKTNGVWLALSTNELGLTNRYWCHSDGRRIIRLSFLSVGSVKITGEIVGHWSAVEYLIFEDFNLSVGKFSTIKQPETFVSLLLNSFWPIYFLVSMQHAISKIVILDITVSSMLLCNIAVKFEKAIPPKEPKHLHFYL